MDSFGTTFQAGPFECRLLVKEEMIMIEVKVNIQDVDYATAVEVLMPVLLERLSHTSNPLAAALLGRTRTNSLPAAAAKAALEVLPKSVQDELSAACLNHYSTEIAQAISNLAAQKGIRLRIDAVEVAVSE